LPGYNSLRHTLVLIGVLVGLSINGSEPAPATGEPDKATKPTAHADVQIGRHDIRDGYEKTSFVTQTQSLTERASRSANLSALIRSPPLGLTSVHQPPSDKLIDLGRRLFFERRLSANDTLSCGMCHIPEQAFTQNELATPVGIEGSLVLRNAPSLYNVAYRKTLFHDGRETSLEEQVWAPLLAANEMGNSSRERVLEKVTAIDGYSQAFNGAFTEGLTAATLGAALAAYQRALLSANSAFDRWYYGGEMAALSAAAKRGFRLFDQHGCAACHPFERHSAQFTDDEFHNTGIGFASELRDRRQPETIQLAPGVFVPFNAEIDLPDRHDYGRQTITGNAGDKWRFRTPSLRNVALTGPYMHDGSLNSLEAVLAFYNRGGSGDPGADERIKPLNLTKLDQQALLEFLHSLTSDNVDALAADARSAPVGDRQQELQ